MLKRKASSRRNGGQTASGRKERGATEGASTPTSAVRTDGIDAANYAHAVVQRMGQRLSSEDWSLDALKGLAPEELAEQASAAAAQLQRLVNGDDIEVEHVEIDAMRQRLRVQERQNEHILRQAEHTVERWRAEAELSKVRVEESDAYAQWLEECVRFEQERTSYFELAQERRERTIQVLGATLHALQTLADAFDTMRELETQRRSFPEERRNFFWRIRASLRYVFLRRVPSTWHFRREMKLRVLADAAHQLRDESPRLGFAAVAPRGPLRQEMACETGPLTPEPNGAEGPERATPAGEHQHLGSHGIAPSNERRVAGRLPQELLECSLGQIVNLSLNGMCIDSEEPIEGNVQIEIRAPQDSLVLEGQVRWSTRVARGRHRTGIRFYAMTSADREKLAHIGESNRRRATMTRV